MDCQSVARQLNHGNFDREVEREVIRHLDACPACYDQHEPLINELRTYGILLFPPHDEPRLEEAS